ncbi:lycopene cyclase domain-containing protein [bacterium]|nr:lycopene cyclase domain-containing protein [bacterium]
MTYWLINAPFLVIAGVVAAVAVLRGARPAAVPWLVAFVVMMTLTAMFDNAIIGFGLVDYNDALISGIRLGFAPLEDFAYTLAALLIIPALWHLLAPKK